MIAKIAAHDALQMGPGRARDFCLAYIAAMNQMAKMVVDVIAHILHYAPGITTEPLEVLSMYDGMSCGHLALDKLGARIARYYATEIDKYAIRTTQHNFPGTIQLGDAFQVRDDGWHL